MDVPISFVKGMKIIYYSQKIDLKELENRILKRVDSFVEYPGSRKGDFGEWRLTDWVNAKIEQFSSKGGRERG